MKSLMIAMIITTVSTYGSWKGMNIKEYFDYEPNPHVLIMAIKHTNIQASN